VELLKHILFIDIETVACVANFGLLSESMQAHWARKAKFLKSKAGGEEVPSVLFDERAGIYSEFAKVVSIGMGCLVERDGEWKVLLKSLSDDDERALLEKFCEAVTRFQTQFPDMRFCGHNIKEFDLPFLSRRMLIQGMQLPQCLDMQGRKPWEVPHLDTLELWRFGDYKHFTSLGLLAEVLGLPSPKGDLDGSMVNETYWKEHDIERINRYCLQDVYTTAKVYLRLKGISDMQPEPLYVTE